MKKLITGVAVAGLACLMLAPQAWQGYFANPGGTIDEGWPHTHHIEVCFGGYGQLGVGADRRVERDHDDKVRI